MKEVKEKIRELKKRCGSYHYVVAPYKETEEGVKIFLTPISPEVGQATEEDHLLRRAFFPAIEEVIRKKNGDGVKIFAHSTPFVVRVWEGGSENYYIVSQPFNSPRPQRGEFIYSLEDLSKELKRGRKFFWAVGKVFQEHWYDEWGKEVRHHLLPFGGNTQKGDEINPLLSIRWGVKGNYEPSLRYYSTGRAIFIAEEPFILWEEYYENLPRGYSQAERFILSAQLTPQIVEGLAGFVENQAPYFIGVAIY